MHPLKRPVAVSALTALTVLLAASIADPAGARSRGEANRDDFAQSRPAGVPLLAVVSLNDQRVTIYDAEGKVLRAPVSTGQTGYETPAGIYSIIEKNREHYSNLYDDASMPFMQRITWSGIALHAGVLPGRPASHGCIRLPYRFAEQIFDLTKMGMRVVVVRDDMSPVEIAHPSLFKPGPVRPEIALASAGDRPSDAMDRRSMRLGVPPADAGTPARAQTWRQIAAAKVAQAEAATKTAEEARRTAVRTRADSARLAKDLRITEGAKQRAEAQLRDAERMLDEALRRHLETRRAAQHQATLEPGRRHRDVPSLPFRAETVCDRHARLLEEDLGKPRLAVDLPDAAHAHAVLAQRHEKEREPAMTL
jgi:hypothetical protein